MRKVVRYLPKARDELCGGHDVVDVNDGCFPFENCFQCRLVEAERQKLPRRI